MKRLMLLGWGSMAAFLTAADADRKTLRLVPADARLVAGIDLDRYRLSPLSALQPAGLEWLFKNEEKGNDVRIGQLIRVEWDRNREPLLILRGTISPDQVRRFEENEEIPVRGGVPVVRVHEVRHIAILDTETAIYGDEEAVGAALNAWHREPAREGALAEKVRQVSGSGDVWFVTLRPLENLKEEREGRGSQRLEDLIRTVVEVRGAVRLGASIDFWLEAVTKSAEDAEGLAAIGRWLPGLIELKGQGNLAAVVSLVENLQARAIGEVAFVSASIDPSRLGEFVKTIHRP